MIQCQSCGSSSYQREQKTILSRTMTEAASDLVLPGSNTSTNTAEQKQPLSALRVVETLQEKSWMQNAYMRVVWVFASPQNMNKCPPSINQLVGLHDMSVSGFMTLPWYICMVQMRSQHVINSRSCKRMLISIHFASATRPSRIFNWFSLCDLHCNEPLCLHLLRQAGKAGRLDVSHAVQHG